MAQYIDKDAVVAEIERLRDEKGTFYASDVLYNLEDFIDTLEVTEVDFEKEINRWQGCEAFPEGVGITPLPKAMEIVERTARHFFELGLQVNNKAQKGE